MTRVFPALLLSGLAWLAILSFVAAWPDMEASVFDAATASAADGRIGSLRCPILLLADERAAVTATFTNRADAPSTFLVRSRIAEGFMTVVREDTRQVTVAPGASTELDWPVSADDAVYGRIVMVRVLATRSAVAPARHGACGSLVLGVHGFGIPGDRLFWLGVLAGLALAGGGAYGWLARMRPLHGRTRTSARRAGLLSLVVGISLACGVAGLWLPSHLLLLLAALLLLLMLEDGFSVLGR